VFALGGLRDERGELFLTEAPLAGVSHVGYGTARQSRPFAPQ
jgi:hypothetical protein